jgi:hypothetical protein
MFNVTRSRGVRRNCRYEKTNKSGFKVVVWASFSIWRLNTTSRMKENTIRGNRNISGLSFGNTTSLHPECNNITGCKNTIHNKHGAVTRTLLYLEAASPGCEDHVTWCTR